MSQVEEFIRERCAHEFDTAMLESVRDGLLATLMGWIKCLFGKGEQGRVWGNMKGNDWE